LFNQLNPVQKASVLRSSLNPAEVARGQRTALLRTLRAEGFRIRTQTFFNVANRIERQETGRAAFRNLAFGETFPETFFSRPDELRLSTNFRVTLKLEVRDRETKEVFTAFRSVSSDTLLTRAELEEMARAFLAGSPIAGVSDFEILSLELDEAQKR